MGKKIIQVIVMAVIIVTLASCAATPRALDGEEREAVLAYSEPMADNEFAALNANDYEAFIKDYDDAMLAATTPANFANLISHLSSKLGKYVSRDVSAVTAIGDEAILVVYNAKFENEDGVTVRLIFQPDGKHLITGLWFDSPKLREK